MKDNLENILNKNEIYFHAIDNLELEENALDFFIYWYSQKQLEIVDFLPEDIARMKMILKDFNVSEIGEMAIASVFKESSFELLFSNIKRKTKNESVSGVDLFAKKDDKYFFIEVKTTIVHTEKNVKANLKKAIEDVERRLNDLESHLIPVGHHGFYNHKGELNSQVKSEVDGIAAVLTSFNPIEIKKSIISKNNTVSKFGRGIFHMKYDVNKIGAKLSKNISKEMNKKWV